MNNEDRANAAIVVRLKKLNELGSELPNIGDYGNEKMQNEKLAMAEVVKYVRKQALQEAAKIAKNVYDMHRDTYSEEGCGYERASYTTAIGIRNSIISLINKEESAWLCGAYPKQSVELFFDKFVKSNNIDLEGEK